MDFDRSLEAADVGWLVDVVSTARIAVGKSITGAFSYPTKRGAPVLPVPMESARSLSLPKISYFPKPSRQ